MATATLDETTRSAADFRGTTVTDSPKPEQSPTINLDDAVAWPSAQSLFSERHSDPTGVDAGPVPGNVLPTFLAATTPEVRQC